MSVFVYVNTSKQVGDPDHLKVFADRDAADAWSRKRSGRRGVRVLGSGMKEAGGHLSGPTRL